MQNRLESLSQEKRELVLRKLQARKLAAACKDKCEMLPILPISREGEIPLSFAQQRLWFLDQLEGQNAVYNMPAALRLTGSLCVEALEQTLNKIVERHEALRTTFAVRNERPVQIIASEFTIPLPVIDLQQLSESKQKAEVERLAVEEAQKPFDLTKCPLFRAILLRLRHNPANSIFDARNIPAAGIQPTLINPSERHVLLINMHHIVSDGWSLGIIIRELSILYEAFISSKPSPLPQLSIQYADFALWQRKWLQGERSETQLNYWKQQLAGAPPLLELTTDRPRPAVQTFRGSARNFHLNADLTLRLNRLGQRSGTTLFMTLLAAIGILLSRYSGRKDIIVGSPIANRTRKEIESLIGFFANTIVLRMDLSGDPSFTSLLKRIKEVALEAYAHQDVPFERLLEELQSERNLSYAPLFQVMFILQNAPAEALELSGLTIEPLSIKTDRSHFDLVLCITETDSKLSGVLEYNSDLFEAATIVRIIEHFKILLEGIAVDPDQRISALPLLSETEQRQLLSAWNDTGRQYPYDRCIHHIFESQVERTPDDIAVIFENKKLSYAELNLRSNQLAHVLRKKGIGQDAIAGIMIDRSLEMVIGILGILKAGGAYLPIDPAYPEERVLSMLEDSGASLLLTKDKIIEHLFHENRQSLSFEQTREIVLIDKIAGEIAQKEIRRLENINNSNDLAYVLYTSGSTGKPKGIAMEHRPLVNLISWHLGKISFSEPARTLQFAPFGFDVSFQEMFSTWCSGGTLILISDEIRRDPVALLHFLNEKNIERLFLPFVALQQLAEAARNFKDIPESLREVIIAGEQLRITAAIVDLFKRLKKCALHNHYGPSESHVVTTFTLDGQADSWPVLPPIGRPVDNTRIYILNSDTRLVPVGVRGELYIGGVPLARGYIGRPDLTDKKFIPNPFSNKKGARLYRTGDLARYLPDGNIEYLGRIDSQIKIRGFRIEPGEIETRLAEHPEILEAAVVMREYEPGDKRLAAYVSLDSGSGITSFDLRNYLKEKLPEYMIPSFIIILEKLPLTSSGKIDRRLLPAPEASDSKTEENSTAFATPVEEVMTTIWAQVLKLNRIGINDNFFELGGHSLLATQLISRIRDVFSIELSVRRLFESPTITDLSKYLESASDRPYIPPIVPAGRDKSIPLSFAQERLWFLDQMEGKSANYNMPAAVHLSGRLHVAALEQSISEIVRRHEVLRTIFAVKNGQPVQNINSARPVTLPIIDLQHLSKEEQSAEVLRLSIEEARKPFNLAKGPLLRGTLLRLHRNPTVSRLKTQNIIHHSSSIINPPEEHVLMMTMHHIVSDNWSIGILLRELSFFYTEMSKNAFSHQIRPSLPELPIQYADFALWQFQWLTGEVLEKQLNYWKRQLSGTPQILELSGNPQSLPTSGTSSCNVEPFEIDIALTEKLKALSRKSGATLFMTLLAGFAVLLYRYTGIEDIVVGSPIANRNRREIESLIGFFVNTIVLRIDLSGEPDFLKLLTRVRRVALDAYAHQDIPFEKLVKELHPARSVNRHPLVQVVFALQNAPVSVPELPGLIMKPLKVHSATAKFDLIMSITETEGVLTGVLEYNTNLFDKISIVRMADHFKMILEQIVTIPGRRLLDIPLSGSRAEVFKDESEQFNF